MRTYQSVLSRYIIGLIEQKQSCGYRYEYEAYILEMFDRFCLDRNHDMETITRDLVMAWAVQRATEGKNYRNQRVSFIRQLALFMRSLGIDAYVPGHFASTTTGPPHILSSEQLKSFFSEVDAYRPPQLSYRRLTPTYQVLFRLFYCCGLRLSEGCFLRRSHVDLSDNVLHILKSKGNKDRIVFMSPDVSNMCAVNDAYLDRILPNRKWFFPGGKEDRPFEKTSLDKKFTQFWNRTPFAGKVDKKPTIQSLRHTFVVNKMNDWMEADIDTAVMMPYLSRYLGHASIVGTQYYFHTIERAFPIVRRHDGLSSSIIPEVSPYEIR